MCHCPSRLVVDRGHNLVLTIAIDVLYGISALNVHGLACLNRSLDQVIPEFYELSIFPAHYGDEVLKSAKHDQFLRSGAIQIVRTIRIRGRSPRLGV